MIQVNQKKQVFNVWSLITTLVLIPTCVFISFSAPRYFEALPLLVFFASLLFEIVLLPCYFYTKSTTILLLSVCVTLKYIITPLFYCIAPITSFSYYFPSDLENINSGIGLMLYELIVVSLCTSLFALHDHKRIQQRATEGRYEKILNEKKYVVFGFSLLAIAIAIFVPISREGLSFMFLDANTGSRVSAMETSTAGVFFRQVVLIGIYSLFIVLAVWCAKKYNLKQQKMYIVLALVFAALVTMVIVSEARSSQVYSGFACVVLLSTLFPRSQRKIQIVLFAVAFSVIGILSIYKMFHAFSYTSYADAIDSAEFDMSSLTFYSEIYFLGPLHYTASIDLASSGYTFSFSRLLFGLLRSTMGTNFLVRDLDMSTTSMLFNEFITGGRANTGFLLPITGLGYVYLTPIFAPLFLCVVYRFALKMEFWMKKSESAFGLFFLSYVFIRMSTALISTNINTILTNTSMILLTAGLLYFANRFLKFKPLR